MTLLQKLRSRIRKEQFTPTWLGVLLNPAYIIRSGLYQSIKDLAPKVRGNILDFGCGSKPYESLFINATSYIGCDTHSSGHNHLNSRVDFYFDGRTLLFGEQQFDAVVSFEVFEHVFELPDVLQEINRVTKDNGLLLISVPFAWAEHEIPFDYARYTSFGITHLLEKNGYEVLERRITSSYLLTVFQLLISYLIQIAPNNRLYHLFQIFLFFPLTSIAYVLDWLLPNRSELYLGNVLLARKNRGILE